jgi:transcriptional antiterminator
VQAARARPESYVADAESFEPHDWVIDAILISAHLARSENHELLVQLATLRLDLALANQTLFANTHLIEQLRDEVFAKQSRIINLLKQVRAWSGAPVPGEDLDT